MLDGDKCQYCGKVLIYAPNNHIYSPSFLLNYRQGYHEDMLSI